MPKQKRDFDIKGALNRVSSRVVRPKGWVPPNSVALVDPEALGPDVRLRWIRKYFSGAEEDKTSFFRRQARGWIPVSAEELPKYATLRDPEGNIASSGCILCKIPTETALLDVQYYEDLAQGALETATGEFDDASTDGRVRTKVITAKRSSMKGREPANA